MPITQVNILEQLQRSQNLLNLPNQMQLIRDERGPNIEANQIN